jgi:DNA polymerase V
MLDLNNYLIKHPASTFIVKVSGDSMKDAGINLGSLLLVDRSIELVSGKIVVAALNGELTVKRLSVSQEKVLLIAENPDYPSIEITEELEMVVWGVVTSMIQEFD